MTDAARLDPLSERKPDQTLNPEPLWLLVFLFVCFWIFWSFSFKISKIWYRLSQRYNNLFQFLCSKLQKIKNNTVQQTGSGILDPIRSCEMKTHNSSCSWMHHEPNRTQVRARTDRWKQSEPRSQSWGVAVVYGGQRSLKTGSERRVCVWPFQPPSLWWSWRIYSVLLAQLKRFHKPWTDLSETLRR